MKKYEFVKGEGVDFFRSALTERDGLLTMSPDPDDHDGVSLSVCRYAQHVLTGLDEEDVLGILRLADEFVDSVFIDRLMVNTGTESVLLTKELLQRIRPTEILPVMISMLEEYPVALGDFEGNELLISGERLCCAYALTQVWHSRFGDEASGYAIEAAKAQAMARLLSGADSILSEVLKHRFAKVQAAKHANSRWGRLEPVKDLAFQRRKEMSGLSRAEAIRRMLAEIRSAAEAAGERLSGQDTEKTIERWFRKAGIR
ncbi:hypothetical protein [Lysobacter tyrosinilyticus]